MTLVGKPAKRIQVTRLYSYTLSIFSLALLWKAMSLLKLLSSVAALYGVVRAVPEPTMKFVARDSAASGPRASHCGGLAVDIVYDILVAIKASAFCSDFNHISTKVVSCTRAYHSCRKSQQSNICGDSCDYVHNDSSIRSHRHDHGRGMFDATGKGRLELISRHTPG